MEDVKTKRRVSLSFFQRWKRSLRFQLLGNSAKLDKSLEKAGIIRKQFDFKVYIHTCIHTYIHTYIHIYIQTDRQTDRQTDMSLNILTPVLEYTANVISLCTEHNLKK